MPSLKEAIIQNKQFVGKIHQKKEDGYYLEYPDAEDCLMETVSIIVLQAEHLQNSSQAIEKEAQKLLNSLSGQC